MKILVLRPGAMGDLLLALPAIRALKQRFPDAAIDVAGNAEFGPVLALSPDVSAVYDFGSGLFSGLFVEENPPSPELVETLSVYDLSVAWLADPGGLLRRRLLACGIRRVTGGDPRSRDPTGRHLAFRLWDLLAELHPPELDLSSLPLRPPPVPAGGSPVPVAVLHPGSGGRSKMWPLEQFASMAAALLERGSCVRVLSGPADGDVGDRVIADLAGRAVHVRPAGILALAAEIAPASLYIGNDTGPTHLAAALGVPTLALFGPTDPAVWSPIGPRVRVLGGNGSWPSLEYVLASAQGFGRLGKFGDTRLHSPAK